MTDKNESTEKVHYICQTYVARKDSRSGQAELQIGKQLQYTTESQAQERAEREFQSDDCVGADAYMVTEDLGSGEVSPPTFLGRFGKGPELRDF